MSQSEKYYLSMAGEYLVVAQLQRLQVSATITYGNAKRTDVIAFSSDNNNYITVEVKTSNKGRWPIGNRVPEPDVKKIWVFVQLPENLDENPEFYIMTQEEIYENLAPIENEYMNRYKEKHGTDYGNKPGVATMNIKIAQQYKNQWETLINLLK